MRPNPEGPRDADVDTLWLDRAGRELGVLGPPADHYAPRLSPDGTRLALSRLDPNSTNGDIWLMDLDPHANKVAGNSR